MGIGLGQILIVVLILLVVFRPRKVPELGRALGESIRKFKQAMNEIEVPPEDIQDLQKPDHNRQKEKPKEES